jgi:hypothetical protein
MNLTTREVSILVWAAAFFAWTLMSPGVRTSFKSMLDSAFSRTIIVFVLAIGVYVGAEVYLLRNFGLWTPALLKETMLWFGLTGVSSAVASMSVSEEPNLSKPLWDSFRIMVLMELLIGKVTFSLPVELVLVPLAAFVGTMCVYAEWKHKDELIHVFLRRLQVLFGFTILAVLAHRAFQDPLIFVNRGVMAEYLIAPILTALFIPALYLCNVYSRYEWLFCKVRGDRSYTWYAKWRLIRLLGFRTKRILAFGRQHAFTLPGVRTRDEFDLLFSTPSNH